MTTIFHPYGSSSWSLARSQKASISRGTLYLWDPLFSHGNPSALAQRVLVAAWSAHAVHVVVD